MVARERTGDRYTIFHRRVHIPRRPPPILRYSRWLALAVTRVFFSAAILEIRFARVIVYAPMSRSALIKHRRADISKSEKRSTTRCELLPHFFPRYSITRVARFHASSCFPPSIQEILPDFSMYTRTKEREREREISEIAETR